MSYRLKLTIILTTMGLPVVMSVIVLTFELHNKMTTVKSKSIDNKISGLLLFYAYTYTG